MYDLSHSSIHGQEVLIIQFVLLSGAICYVYRGIRD